MCGLISAFNDKKVNEWVIDQLQDQLHRGQEGFGILMLDKENKVKLFRATEITKTLLDLYLNESKSIILHHRYPTSSENKISQTHPIKVSNEELDYDYYVIHNGVIRNSDELKKEHEENKYIYTTDRVNNKGQKEFNDSESFAIELAKFIDGQSKEIKSQGSIAFIALKVEKETGKALELCYGRKDNPLNIAASKKMIKLSSEGQGNEVKEKTLYIRNLKTLETKKRKLLFKETPIVTTKPIVGFNAGRKYQEKLYDEYKYSYPWDEREEKEEEIKQEKEKEIIEIENELIENVSTEIMELIDEVVKPTGLENSIEETTDRTMDMIKYFIEEATRRIEMEITTTEKQNELIQTREITQI